AGQEDRAPVLEGLGGRGVGVDLGLQQDVGKVDDQADDVLPGGDAGDGAGEDVVEHERRDGQLGREAAHGLADDAVDAAADEHGAALDVDPADGVAEAHDRQDEPGGGGADGLLDDGPDVVGGAGEVAEDDGGGAPVADEGEHHAADDDDAGALDE